MARGLMLFLHLLGMAVWLGGLLALGSWTGRARRHGDLRVIAFTYATARRLYGGMVSAAAWVSIGSGVALTFITERAWFRPFPEHWLFQMQILGLLALLATQFYLVPNARALADLAERGAESGELPGEFAGRVKGGAVAGSMLGIVLLYLVLVGSLRF